MLVVGSDGVVSVKGVEVFEFKSLLEVLGMLVLLSDGAAISIAERASSSLWSMLPADATTVSLFFWPPCLRLFLGPPRLILFLVGIVYDKMVPCRTLNKYVKAVLDGMLQRYTAD